MGLKKPGWTQLPEMVLENTVAKENDGTALWLVIPVIGIILIGAVYLKKRK